MRRGIQLVCSIMRVSKSYNCSDAIHFGDRRFSFFRLPFGNFGQIFEIHSNFEFFWESTEPTALSAL